MELKLVFSSGVVDLIKLNDVERKSDHPYHDLLFKLLLKILDYRKLPPGFTIKDINRYLLSMGINNVYVCEYQHNPELVWYYTSHSIDCSETLRVIEFVEMVYPIYFPEKTLKIIDMSTPPLKSRISNCIIS